MLFVIVIVVIVVCCAALIRRRKFECIQVTNRDFQTIRLFLEKKSQKLMDHEKKNYAIFGSDLSKYLQINHGKRRFFVIASGNVFKEIIDDVLICATEKYPQNFGKNRTDLILDALYDIEPVNSRVDFGSFLQDEKFVWIIELLNNGDVNPNILRVDLFRVDNGCEFTSGVLHVFKHFSYKDVPLSTQHEINNLLHPKEIYYYLIKAFFYEIHELSKTKLTGETYRSSIKIDNKYQLKCEFFFEPVTEVYFVNSVHKQSIK